MEELLNELFLLREIELLSNLTEKQKNRYVEIVDLCKTNDIDIPFGIEI